MEKRNEWQVVVLDALVEYGILREEHVDNPKLALKDLIKVEIKSAETLRKRK